MFFTSANNCRNKLHFDHVVVLSLRITFWMSFKGHWLNALECNFVQNSWTKWLQLSVFIYSLHLNRFLCVSPIALLLFDTKLCGIAIQRWCRLLILFLFQITTNNCTAHYRTLSGGVGESPSLSPSQSSDYEDIAATRDLPLNLALKSKKNGHLINKQNTISQKATIHHVSLLKLFILCAKYW